MSTAVGIVHRGSVILACDAASTATGGGLQITLATCKMSRLPLADGRALLCAFTGSHHLQEAATSPAFLSGLLSAAPPPSVATPQEIGRFLSDHFAAPLHSALQDRGQIKGDLHQMDGRALIGFDGHLSEVQWGLHVRVWDLPYCAVGSGAPYALGILHTSGGSALTRIRKALAAAEFFDACTRGPFYLLREKGEPELWEG